MNLRILLWSGVASMPCLIGQSSRRKIIMIVFPNRIDFRVSWRRGHRGGREGGGNCSCWVLNELGYCEEDQWHSGSS